MTFYNKVIYMIHITAVFILGGSLFPLEGGKPRSARWLPTRHVEIDFLLKARFLEDINIDAAIGEPTPLLKQEGGTRVQEESGEATL